MPTSRPDYKLALAALLEANTPSEKRSVIENHPELLDDVTLEALSQMAARTKGSRRALSERLMSLLMECRSVGIEAAIRDIAQQEELEEALPNWIVADSPRELKDAIERFPVLLSDRAERELRKMDEKDDDAYSRDRYALWISLLRSCRTGDVDTALSEYQRDLTDVENANELAGQWLSAKTQDERATLLREHPALCLRRVEEYLTRFLAAMEEATKASNSDMAPVERIRSGLEKLRGLRDNRGA